jgi:hypothetical protein
MLYSIERGKSRNNKNAWFDLRGEYDEYEMDNFSEVARTIQINERQARNFHQQYVETGSVWSQCDIDWVRFIPNCTSSYLVTTSQLQNRPAANTRLTIFSGNPLNQLAQNDDISATNKFSSITITLNAGTEYWIRVDNSNPTFTGYYNLIVSPIADITGPDIICGSSQTYTASISQGINVSWSSGNTNIATINPSTGLATPVQGASGTVTFTASVIICGQTFTQTKQVTVAQSGFITGYYTMSVDPTQTPLTDALYRSVMVRRGQTVGINFTITGSTNVSLLRWYYDNLIASGNTLSISITAPQQGYSSVTKSVFLDLTTPCGIVRNTYTFNVMSSGWSMRISPNPVREVLSVNLDNNAATVTSATQKISKPAATETRFSLLDANSNLRIRTWLFKEGERTNYQLQLSGIKSGVYILKLERGSETVTSKVIVQ